MDKMFAGITGFCVVLCAVMITIMVAVVSFRVVYQPQGDSQQIADNQMVNEEDSWNPARTARRPKRKNPPQRRDNDDAVKPQRTMYVAVDQDDVMAARTMEDKRIRELLDEADKLTGKLDNRKRKKFLSLMDLSDEEKNRIWWEIESRAERYDGEQITYTLTFSQAARISRFYNTSTLEVFNLFREGATADWRTPEPPLLTGQEPDEDGKQPGGRK